MIVSSLSTDDSTYDTVFQTVSGATLILRVQMPPLIHPNAPIRRPSMSLAGIKARHSWLDDRMQVVGFGPIQSDEAWRSSRLLLGAAVHQVIEELQLRPPVIIEITDKGLRSIQPKQNGVSHGDPGQVRRSSLPTNPTQPTVQAATSVGHRRVTSQVSHTTAAPPDYDSSFSAPSINVDTIQMPRQFNEIEALPMSRIKELLDDELEFMAFCHGLPVLQKAHNKGTERYANNLETANKHLTHKERLESLSEEVASLHKSLQDRVATFQKLEKQQDSLLAPPDESLALRQLAQEKKLALQNSEQLAEEWLAGGATEPLTFVKDFVERRKEHHVAAAKMELLQLQCRR